MAVGISEIQPFLLSANVVVLVSLGVAGTVQKKVSVGSTVKVFSLASLNMSLEISATVEISES